MQPNEVYFFKIVPIAILSFLPLMSQCLDPIGQQSYQWQIGHHELFRQPSCVCVCVCVGAMSKLGSKLGKYENNTDISLYQIYLAKFHENILD